LSGTIGDKVFRQLPDGRTIECKKPDFSNREFSQGQVDTQARFKRAVQYAREASKTQPVYAILAEGKATNAYNLALSDWFSAPEVHAMDLSGWNGAAGDPVRVQARDDVHVKHVLVKISDGNGELLEEGRATETTEKHWFEYTTMGNYLGVLTVTVTAIDLPGNMTELSREKTIS